jgi:hypothetical protein
MVTACMIAVILNYRPIIWSDIVLIFHYNTKKLPCQGHIFSVFFTKIGTIAEGFHGYPSTL